MENYQSVIPDLPDPELYLNDIKQIHNAINFTNFGPFNNAFEDELNSKYANSIIESRCICASNATSALSAALIGAGINGQVIVPAFTFPASYGAIKSASCEPILIDVAFDNWASDLSNIENAINKTNASAIMLIKPFGIEQDFTHVIDYCTNKGLKIFIDNAAGLGVERLNKEVQSNLFEIYSFHATKPFGIGEGGCIFTHKDNENNIRSALNFGLKTLNSPTGPSFGINGKLSEFHAAIGMAQIRRIDNIVFERQKFANSYIDILNKYDSIRFIRDSKLSPWQFFPVQFNNVETADKFVKICAEYRLEIRKYYNPSLSEIRGAKSVNGCPNSEKLSKLMCVLPIRSGKFLYQLDELLGIVETCLYKTLG